MNLVFDRGQETFSKEDFLKHIGPYLEDLKKHNRTNFLFVATFGDGSKPAITGYNTDTTINATINKFVLRSEHTGGKWAVYRKV